MSEHVASAIIPTGSGKSFIAGLTKVTACKECGGNDFFWATHYIPSQSIPEGRLRTSDVQCTFVLGCNYCSETLATVSAENLAAALTKAVLEA